MGDLVWAQNYAGIATTEPQAQLPSQSQVLIEPKASEVEQDINKILSQNGIPLVKKVDPKVQEGLSNYTLGVEDVIEIVVMRHPEVSGQYLINSEGKIQYEFIGDLQLSGLTKSQIADLVVKTLSTYIINPEVTVKILAYNSKVVYVIGEVGNPGKIYMRGDTITVREALIQAGLPLLSANTVDSKLVTPSDDGKPGQRKVNVHKLLIGGDLRQNFIMKPGDTLYVPPTLLAKAMRIIQPVAQPITKGAEAANGVMTPLPGQ